MDEKKERRRKTDREKREPEHDLVSNEFSHARNSILYTLGMNEFILSKLSLHICHYSCMIQ